MRDAEYDEISTVDRPANQHGQIVIAKRATQEDAVADNEADTIVDEDGNEVDWADLDVGDVIYAEDGSAYEVTDEDDDDEDADVYDEDLESVGKAAPIAATKSAVKGFAATAKQGRKIARSDLTGNKYWVSRQNASRSGKLAHTVGRWGPEAAVAGGAGGVGVGAYEGHKHIGKSELEDIREELSKAITEADQVSVLAKAFESVERRAEDAEARIQQSEQIAKSERELRLTREYIAKAAQYNVPIQPERLGPVLMRMAETMSYDDCAVIHKALTTSGALLEEIGKAGGGDNADPFAQIDELLEGEVSKSGDRAVSKAHQITSYFDANPDAYEQYRAARAGR